MSSSIRTLFRRLTSTHSPLITTTNTFLRRSHQSSLPASPLRLITTTTTTTTPSRQFTTSTTIRRSAETSDLGVPPPRRFLDRPIIQIVNRVISVPVTVGWLIYFYIIIKIELEEHYAGVNKKYLMFEADDNLNLQMRELQQSLLSIKRDLEQQKLMKMQSEKQL